MAEPQERDPSLEDEIFAVASHVEAAPKSPPLRWERAPRLTPRAFGAGLAGAATFVLVDAVMMWAPLMSSRRGSLLPQMVTLMVLAFGLGGLLAWQVGGRWRPFGFGMMAGWLFLTLISLGFLTGVGW